MIIMNKMIIECIKWYFNTTKWHPTREQWLKLTSSVSNDELTRINRFVFKEDTKSTLIGQALLHSFVSRKLWVPSDLIKFTRTTMGRPILLPEFFEEVSQRRSLNSLDFNISHSGDYCILAGIMTRSDDPLIGGDHPIDNHRYHIAIGADVQQIFRKDNDQDLSRFLTLMSRREFLPDEWNLVINSESNLEKCINFTRLWSLKESFIKAEGSGLSFGLSKISFSCPSPFDMNCPDVKRSLRDTTVKVDLANDGKLVQDPTWLFDECALDEKHIAVVAYNLKNANEDKLINMRNIIDYETFREVDINELIQSLNPMRPENPAHWDSFVAKPNKTP